MQFPKIHAAVMLVVLATVAPLVAMAGQAGASTPTVYGWGDAKTTTPMPVGPLAGATLIDAGNKGSVGIVGGTVLSNLNENRAGKHFAALAGLSHVAQIADGDFDYVALEAPTGLAGCPTDTSVWTWGENIDGDLGTGVPGESQNNPATELSALTDIGVVQVVAASRHMMALTCTGQVYVWGWNFDDDLGITSPDQVTTPSLNPKLSALTGGTSSGVELSDGRSNSAMLVNGQAYTWGTNNQEQCGCGRPGKYFANPQTVTQPEPFVSIDGGGDEGTDGQNLGLTANGVVYCWGDNRNGECGNSSLEDLAVPTVVPGLPPIKEVAAGGLYSLFLDTGGNVWGLGANKSGELGSSTSTEVTTPIEVLAGDGIDFVSAGALHALAES